MASFIQVTNYRVVNNTARILSPTVIKNADIRAIIGIRVTLDGRSTTLYNVSMDSGSICITDDFGVRNILESFGKQEPPINTYTVINGIARLNDTRYVNYTTVTKLTLVKTDKGEIYECTSPFNTVLFYTDKEGSIRIVEGL